MEFNLQRIALLLRKDLQDIVLKSLAIIALIVFSISTFNLIIANFVATNGRHSFDLFGTGTSVFLISCSVLGAISYEEINKRPTRIEFLNLPASTLEKTLSKFLSVGIIFPISIMVLYGITYLYLNGFNAIMGGKLNLSYHPELQIHILLIIGAIITSFFAYGSIKFNTGSYPKIVLWGLGALAIFGLIMFIYALIAFPEMRATVFGYEHTSDDIVHMNHSEEQFEDLFVIRLIKKLFYIVPLIFWTFSYFTLKEKEA